MRIKHEYLLAIVVGMLVAVIAQTTPLGKSDLMSMGMAPSMADMLGGWTVAAGGDTACNTTCGTAYCIVGLDAGTHAFQTCDDTDSDTCLCTK